MQRCQKAFEECTTFYNIKGLGTNYDTTDSDLEHFLSKTLFGDVFAGEDWKENLCEDVCYDKNYSDKMSERCHKNKMFRKQETIKKPRTWNFSCDPNNLRARNIRSDEGKKMKEISNLKMPKY